MLFTSQPGAIAFHAGFNAELDKELVLDPDAPEDFADDAILAVLGKNALFKCLEVAAERPGVRILDLPPDIDLPAECTGPYEPQCPSCRRGQTLDYLHRGLPFHNPHPVLVWGPESGVWSLESRRGHQTPHSGLRKLI